MVADSSVMARLWATQLPLTIVRPFNTYVRDDVLAENGKIDFAKIHPILFEMQQTRYLRSGDAVSRCWNIGKSLKK